jgi:hypothetical protein
LSTPTTIAGEIMSRVAAGEFTCERLFLSSQLIQGLPLEAAHVALSRLVASGRLARISAGLYAPAPSGTGRSCCEDRIDCFANIIASRSHSQVYLFGKAYAGILSIPYRSKHIYLTDGLDSVAWYDEVKVVFKSAKPSLLERINQEAGRVIQALYWTDINPKEFKCIPSLHVSGQTKRDLEALMPLTSRKVYQVISCLIGI